MNNKKLWKPKSLILVFLAVFISFFSNINAQETDSSWVYHVNFKVIQPSPDSGYFDTDVRIDLNTLVVIDSSTIILKVGTQEGQSDLYYDEYLYAPDILNDPAVSKQGAILQFYLGRFAMPAEHYPVAMEILAK